MRTRFELNRPGLNLTSLLLCLKMVQGMLLSWHLQWTTRGSIFYWRLDGFELGQSSSSLPKLEVTLSLNKLKLVQDQERQNLRNFSQFFLPMLRWLTSDENFHNKTFFLFLSIFRSNLATVLFFSQSVEISLDGNNHLWKKIL